MDDGAGSVEQTPTPPTQFIPAASARSCISNTKAGAPCKWPRRTGRDYCYLHDPTITKAERAHNKKLKALDSAITAVRPLTIDDVLGLVSARISAFIKMHPSIGDAEVEKILCGYIRAYVEVFKVTTDLGAQTIAHYRLGIRRQA